MLLYASSTTDNHNMKIEWHLARSVALKGIDVFATTTHTHFRSLPAIRIVILIPFTTTTTLKKIYRYTVVVPVHVRVWVFCTANTF